MTAAEGTGMPDHERGMSLRGCKIHTGYGALGREIQTFDRIICNNMTELVTAVGVYGNECQIVLASDAVRGRCTEPAWLVMYRAARADLLRAADNPPIVSPGTTPT